MRLITGIWFVLCVLAATQALAQETPDFDALPVISGPDSLDFPADTSTLVWLEPDQPGLFRISTEKAGLIQLYTFETDDGRFDGKTQPGLHRRVASMYRPVTMGPILLDTRFPYIMLVTSKVDNTVRVEQLARLNPAPLGESATLPGDQPLAFRLDGKTSLPAGAQAESVWRIEVLTEPRASRRVRLGRQNVPEAGLSPRLVGKDDTLDIETKIDSGPPPLVWVRTRPSGNDLDEREPNYDREGGQPQALTFDEAFRARALPSGDIDRFSFTLEQPVIGKLEVLPELPFMTFELLLWQHDEGEDSLTVLERKDLQGEQTFDSLHLPAGRLFVQVYRRDDESEPVDYRLRLTATDAPDARREHEPNDTAEAATELPEGNALHGRLAGHGDRDFIRFEIPVDGHRWRLSAVRGVERLMLYEPPNGELIDMKASGPRLIVDALALHQGPYLVELRGEGDYAFKLMDLGPMPENYESEPNNSGSEAHRLYLGDHVSGLFHDGSDNDYYRFELLEDTPVEIRLDAPEDGTVRLRLEGLDGGDFGEAQVGSPNSP